MNKLSRKGVEPKRKFKVGDKVRVLDTSFLAATTLLSVGDIAEVIGYKSDFAEYRHKGGRTVVVSDLGKKYEAGFFRESSLEIVEERVTNESRTGVIGRVKKFMRSLAGSYTRSTRRNQNEQRSFRKESGGY